MEKRKTKSLKAIRLGLWLVAAGMLVLGLLPVWFPWVLKPSLNHHGIHFAHYDRIGYTRFALTGVTGNWEGASLKLRRLEGDLPPAWLWKKLTHRTKGSPIFILEDGDLTLAQSSAKAGEPKAGSDMGSLDQTLSGTMQAVGLLNRFLPTAQLTNCSVQVASNHLLFPYANWHSGQLDTVIRLPPVQGEIVIVAQTKGPDSLGLSVKLDEYESSIRGELTKASAGWHWAGEAGWLTNRAGISAQFATNGWWPVQAQLNCRQFVVPAEFVRRYGYEGLTATFAANIFSNHFSLQASGSARPAEEFATNGFPAATFSLAANGNPDLVNLDELHVQSSWLNANLKNSVGISWSGQLLAKPAQLQVDADLGKLPGAGLTGRAEGVVQITPRGRRQSPVALFHLTASQIHLREADVEHFVVKGRFTSPRVQLDEVRADTADGSQFLAGGSYDFQSEEIIGGEWKCSGAILGKLFPYLSYDSLISSGTVQGPLTNLTHQGELAIKGFHEPRLASLDIHAKWSGRNLLMDVLEISLAAGQSMLALGGQVDLTALGVHKIQATVANLSLSRGGEKLYALQHPCAFLFSDRGTNDSSDNWSLVVDDLDWQGAGREVALTADLVWPARGDVAVTMTNVVFRDFSDFLTNEMPNAVLDDLDVAAQWSNGPIHSTIFISGSLTNGDHKPFALRGQLATGEKISVKQLSVESGYAPTLAVTGNIPVMIIPGRAEGLLDWDQAQPIALTGAFVEPSSRPFTVPITKYGTLTILKPELNVHLSGTVDEPSASVVAGVERMAWRPAAANLPVTQVEDFCLNCEISRGRIALETLSARLDGQPVQVNGDWPLATEDWRALWSEKKLPDWSKAEGRLEIEHMQMAAVARYLPQMLSPEGQMNATLELKPGVQVEGEILLTNAATRPLGRISPLRDIAAQIRFDGQRAVLQEFRGQISGQPIQADGFVDLGDPQGLSYQLNLNGTNVPLARSLEFLLRGDFNLKIRGGSNLPPMVSGLITLRDGLFLQHAAALVWSGPKGTGLQPPYFSITNQPLADCRLDVTVAGDRFLRVQTPVFNGVISADARIRGDLEEPILTGDARISSGSINFPFGTLTVSDGIASLNGNDPHGPNVQLHATGRTLDYDVNLNVSGPADRASIEFSSTPPLSSEEILLLLTVGELPQQQNVLSTEARLGRVASFLGRDLFSRFLGGGPVEDKLIINSGQDISQEGKSTYSVEYRFTDRWSIVGEYDRFNAYNASLKWRILSR